MTRKPSDDMFNPNSLAPALRPAATTALASFERNRALTKAERKTVDELQKQLLVIEGEAKKTQAAQSAIGQLRVSAVETFADTAERINAVCKAPGRDPGTQQYVEHFCDQSTRSAGTFIHQATGAGSDAILEEVGRSLYFPTEEERRGMLKRLFGGNE